MKIIKAKKEDIFDILNLEKKCFTTDAWNESQFQAEFQNEFATILLLKEKEIIGYIDFWIIYEHATVNKICIEDSYRSKGYGSLLLKEALKIIDKNNCLSTSLEVRVSNEVATKLYEKNCFKKALVKKQYYSDGEDCFYLLRSIGDVYER